MPVTASPHTFGNLEGSHGHTLFGSPCFGAPGEFVAVSAVPVLAVSTFVLILLLRCADGAAVVTRHLGFYDGLGVTA